MKTKFLIFAMFLGIMGMSMPCDAQRTHKKHSHSSSSTTTSSVKTSTGLSFSTFTETLKEGGEVASDLGVPTNMMTKIRQFKKFDKIESELKNLGFELVSSKTVQEYDDQMEEYFSYTTNTYNKNNITIEQNPSRIAIKFMDSADKEAFLTSAKNNGYIYNKDWWGGCYVAKGTTEYYWLGVYIFVKGNEVILSLGAE